MVTPCVRQRFNIAAGAPQGIIGWIDEPSLEMTNIMMKEADIIYDHIKYQESYHQYCYASQFWTYPFGVFPCAYSPF
jgi:hypothetical protein